VCSYSYESQKLNGLTDPPPNELWNKCDNEEWVKNFVRRNELDKIWIYDPANASLRQKSGPIDEACAIEALQKKSRAYLISAEAKYKRGQGSSKTAASLTIPVSQSNLGHVSQRNKGVARRNSRIDDPFIPSLTTSRTARSRNLCALYQAEFASKKKNSFARPRGYEPEFGSFSNFVGHIAKNADALLDR